MRFQNAARCIWSPNWPVPLAYFATRYSGDAAMLATAGAGSKLTLMSWLSPKKLKFIRSGMITERM